jgi:hypothetical protein
LHVRVFLYFFFYINQRCDPGQFDLVPMSKYIAVKISKRFVDKMNLIIPQASQYVCDPKRLPRSKGAATEHKQSSWN